MLSKIHGRIERYRFLIRENGFGLVLKYGVDSFFKRKKISYLKFHGHEVAVRVGTCDFPVAMVSLGREFRVLDSIYPRHYSGLIIDAGGYIGTAALAFAKMYPNAVVVSIEPSAENFDILKRNVAAVSNIKPENAALVLDAQAVKSINLNNRGTGSWGFTVIEKPGDREAKFLEKVRTISISDILKKYCFDEVMIFKMDIEGAEHKFFKESGWLSKTKVLVVELHERIVAGCEQAFWDANHGRYVYKDDEGEKYISVGKNFFA